MASTARSTLNGSFEGNEYVTVYTGGELSRIGFPFNSSHACPFNSLPSLLIPKRIVVATPASARYRCTTVERFQQLGLKTKKSAASSASIAVESSVRSTSDDFRRTAVETTRRALGRESSFASSERITTHDAIRASNQARAGSRAVNCRARKIMGGILGYVVRFG